MSDKRVSIRRKMGHSGIVCTPAGALLCACMLDDVSKGGGRLRLAKDMPLPDTFVLHLSRGGTVRRLCRVVWREREALGVEFLTDVVEIAVQDEAC